MDGTGELFADFVRALPAGLETEVVTFPRTETRTYSQLKELVQTACPKFEPYVLLAESFSTPLAVACAASNPHNLKGLILCAGFVADPVSPWLRSVIPLSPFLFAARLPAFAIKWLLVGKDAPGSLVSAVRSAVSSVQPNVLSDRIRSISTCDMRNELSKLSVPILYIQASMDRLIGPACADEMSALNPRVTLSVIEAPHLVLQREPRQAADIVVTFVGRLSLRP